jgi:nicotinamidase-related amidase
MYSEPSEEMAQFFLERGFGGRVGYGERPAVIVIDYFRAFTDPSQPLGANLDRQLEATHELLSAARAAEVPIFYTVVYYDEKDLRDAGLWIRKMSGSATLRAGTPLVELDPRLERRPDEAIVLKKYASAFFGTDLVSRLTVRGIDTLLLAGCTTSGCVRATAVDGLQNGYHVIVVEETVGDRAEQAHQQSLFDLDAKYADVVSLADSVGYLNGLRAAAASRP